MTEAHVEYVDAEPNGIAAMIGGLIEGNLRNHPERVRLLHRATVGIVATDADASLTLRMVDGRVRVANGLRGRPQVIVRTDSTTLTELSSVPLRLGFPDALTAEGRAATRKLLTGDLKVKGLVTRPDIVSRLNRLLSVR